MPHEHRRLSGKIVHVFAHRFVVETAKGAVLADVTPHGAELVDLRIGAEVEMEGDMKPSELKVSRFSCDGKSVTIAYEKKPDHGHHQPAEPRSSPCGRPVMSRSARHVASPGIRAAP